MPDAVRVAAAELRGLNNRTFVTVRMSAAHVAMAA